MRGRGSYLALARVEQHRGGDAQAEGDGVAAQVRLPHLVRDRVRVRVRGRVRVRAVQRLEHVRG